MARHTPFPDPRGGPITLSLADLPPADTRRWVSRKKALVVMAIDQGLVSAEEAGRRYGLSAEELATWRARITAHGVAGLRATHGRGRR